MQRKYFRHKRDEKKPSSSCATFRVLVRTSENFRVRLEEIHHVPVVRLFHDRQTSETF
jgi:hypothetical protein